MLSRFGRPLVGWTVGVGRDMKPFLSRGSWLILIVEKVEKMRERL